ncbi:MAG: hypothetical protein IAE86_12475 [Burkholderiaceae bacterium]|nr:hypothetical protein [Burkholderiaceae bacterium]
MSVRIPLFERLPEVYRQRDAEQSPPGQLEALLDALDSVFGALADRVEQQYDDLFIETCDDWVVPYIADLVGTSHLKGDPRTVRADVARTVYHRRRKGTLGAVESQTFALSGWAAHAVELRDRLAWNMHLNHLRPDAGGAPPWQAAPHNDPRHPVRGGTAALRAPAWLSFVDGPFDPFARTADLKPPVAREGDGPARPAPNLPNLGVFLWRLEDYQVPVSQPSPPRAPAAQVVAQAAPAAPFAVRFDLHPQGEPFALFNTHRFRADEEPPNLADIDSVPHPVPPARLTTEAPAGRPEAYVQVDPYSGVQPGRPSAGAPGLVLHLPDAPFGGIDWRLRGANLCGWEAGLAPPLAPNEIAIDPKRGRVVFGVAGPAQADFADPLVAGLRVSATTGFSGPVGAQPVPHPIPTPGAGTTVLRITRADGPDVLAQALADLALRTTPLVIEIADSLTHELDLSTVPGIGNDAGTFFLRIAQPLAIRALDGERPLIRLAQPLRLRPATIASGAGATPQSMAKVSMHGLYLTRGAGFGAADALVEQAALDTLEFDGCTLDPGGAQLLDGSPLGARAPLRVALHLADGYGLTDANEIADFDQVPQLTLNRCIAGALLVDPGYTLSLDGCIVDAGSGVDDAAPQLAIGAAAGTPDAGWGPALQFDGLTVFGRTRVERARGTGGLFVHRLEVHDNQDSHGALAAPNLPGSCIQHSWFSGQADRLPQHVACVFGTQTRLRFVAQRFGEPGYAQLAWASDVRVREGGPDDDEMGAFGFLLNAHKWKNICIRLREFMPVGIRALLVNVT